MRRVGSTAGCLSRTAFDSHYAGSRTTGGASVQEHLLRHVGRILAAGIATARCTRELSMPLLAIAALGSGVERQWRGVAFDSVADGVLSRVAALDLAATTYDERAASAWLRGRAALALVGSGSSSGVAAAVEQLDALERVLAECKAERIHSGLVLAPSEAWGLCYASHAAALLPRDAPPLSAAASHLVRVARAGGLNDRARRSGGALSPEWSESDRVWTLVMEASSAAAHGDVKAYRLVVGEHESAEARLRALPPSELRAWACATLLLAAARAGDGALADALDALLDDALADGAEAVSGVEAVLALSHRWLAQEHRAGGSPGWRIRVPDAAAAIEVLRERV
jgi:hypothetical protein